MERKLAAILAADIAGYSRLMGEDEEGTLVALQAQRELVGRVIAAHRGRIFHHAGDSIVAEFNSAVAAVQAAIEIQREMARHQADLPAGRRLRFRIGLNIGDVMVENDDLFGDGVNVAARIEVLAPPGGICIARNVFNQVKGKLGVTFEALGEFRVKNIAEPVTVYRVLVDPGTARPGILLWLARLRRHRPALAVLAVLILAVLGAAAWTAWRGVPEGGKPAIAVLPLAVLGGDAAVERLAGGFTEDIITDLAQFRELDVIARTSTAAYKDRALDVRQIGRELGVDYVLEGSLQRQGDRFRVTVQLIDAATGTHLWSERWDRDASDIFGVQTELAAQVANQLGGYGGRLVEAARRSALRKRPENLAAYELYLLGLEAKHHVTQASVEKSIGQLRRATEADPQLARAWTALSFAYGMLLGWVDATPALRKAQLDTARRAVELDPMDAEAHVALAEAVGSSGDFTRAEAELEEALRLNPNSADILTFYAAWASGFGKPERGAAAAERAIRLNPNYQPWAATAFQYAYFMTGRYEDTLRILARKPLESYRRFEFVNRAASFAMLGRMDEAHAAVADTLQRFPGLTVEAFVGDAQWSDAERVRLGQAMRAAGFPLCATPDQLKAQPGLERLPDCAAAGAIN